MANGSSRGTRDVSSKGLELNLALAAKVNSSGAPSPSIASGASCVGTDEEISSTRTPDSRSGAGSPYTTNADIADDEGIYCVEYLHQASEKAHVKLRKTCHRCGNIRKTNISCNRCEQIFCKACARKFEQSSPTGFKFDDIHDGCPVCLKLCCCANPKGHECKSLIHCYRRCEVSRKASKKRAKANSAQAEKKIPYNYHNKRAPVAAPTQRMTPQNNVAIMSTPSMTLVPTTMMDIELDTAESPVVSLGYQYQDAEGDAALDAAEIKLEPGAFTGLDILTRVASSNLLV
jgi:hypothetical protein